MKYDEMTMTMREREKGGEKNRLCVNIFIVN